VGISSSYKIATRTFTYLFSRDKLRAFIAIEGLLSDLPSQSKPKLKRTRADESEQMGLLNSSVAKPQRATSYATDNSKEIAESLLVPSNNLEFISAWNLDGAPTQSTLVSNYSGMSDSEVDLAAEEAHALAEKDLQTSIDHFIHSPISDPLETLPSSYSGDVERLHSPIRPHERYFSHSLTIQLILILVAFNKTTGITL
jgi:hypothetical protein